MLADKQLNIVFMGTPGFAVEPLRAIVDSGRKIAAVITAPDKPAGRGNILRPSAVKQFALENNLFLLQPENLKNPEFIEEVKTLNANVYVVVAFRMLPEVLWSLPHYGTFNLHASLLPNYRGAAPINHVLINGEAETGVTTFFINQQIDTGGILFQEKVPIGAGENAGELHDKLMKVGAKLVVKTLETIESGTPQPKSQEQFIHQDTILYPAPKIHKENCLINWQLSAEKLFNLIRGLSPIPTAFTYIQNAKREVFNLKLFAASVEDNPCNYKPGTIITDGKNSLKIAANDGLLDIKSLQLEGKKRLDTPGFLRGIQDFTTWRIAAV